MAKIRRYDGNGIRVAYDADRCIHAAECVHGLPAVFDPQRRPWIDAAAAQADELAAVITRCPTGALTFERSDDGPSEEISSVNRLTVTPDGPVYATGDIRLLDSERRSIGREIRVAFCRCGASRNKPFCDGRHSAQGFRDAGQLGVPMLRQTSSETTSELTVRLRRHGPLVLEGRFSLSGADGAAVEGSAGALCRCGSSKNKPFCDGTHRDAGFEANDPAAAAS